MGHRRFLSVVLLACLFSVQSIAEVPYSAIGGMGNGIASQTGFGYFVTSVFNQPVVGTSMGQEYSLWSGFGNVLNETSPRTVQIEPPLNFQVSDVPNDNGHFLKLTWDISPSESQGLVSWYRIFRSRNSTMTDPIPISSISIVDSIKFYEQFYTLLVDSVPAGTVEYTDVVMVSDVEYSYWLQAVGSSGSSAKISADFATQVQDMPAPFFVSPPYPNPFNPATTIEVFLPNDNHIVLTIYSVSGQRVAILADSRLRAGQHRFTWNSQGMSSGVYLCKVQAETMSSIKKLLLLK